MKNLTVKGLQTSKGKPKELVKSKIVVQKQVTRWWIWAIALGILLLTFFVYRHSLKNGFTNWDDPVYVVENQIITSLTSENIKAIFNTPVSLNYHPLTMLSLAVDYSFSELDPRGYHTTNLIFHLLNTLLVFGFVFLLSNRRWIPAATVSLLFAIHPMHVESVAWISERKDVLHVFFYLISLILYLRYLGSRKWMWLALAFLAFALAVLSKAVAVTLPIVILGIDYWKKREWSWKIILEKIPFFVFSIIMGLVAYNIQSHGAIAKPGVLTLMQRVIFASYGFWMYIYNMVLPLNLATFYPYPSLNEPGGSLPLLFNISPVIALIIIALVAITYRKTRLFVFGFFFYATTVALVLQFISVGNAVMADRYSYLPYLGLFFIIGHGLDLAWTGKDRIWQNLNIPLTMLVAGFSLWFSVLTFRQIKVWENNETLWSQVIENQPTGWVAYKNRGNYYGEQGKVEKAMADYQVLINNNQMDDQVYANLGNIYRMQNQMDKALEAYEKAANLKPQEINNVINLGIIYSIFKRYDESLANFDKAIQLGAPYKKIGSNRAYTLLLMGRFGEAINEYDKVIELFPNDLTHYQNRGLAWFNLNKYPEATLNFEQALRMAPNNPEVLFNMSVINYKQQKFREALQYAGEAAKAGRQIPESYMNELRSKVR
jgi:tetratricopeptide (TPR) repeat protein